MDLVLVQMQNRERSHISKKEKNSQCGRNSRYHKIYHPKRRRWLTFAQSSRYLPITLISLLVFP